MPIKIRENSIAFHILMYLDAAEGLTQVAINPYRTARQILNGRPSSYRTVLYRLMRSGLVEIIDEEKKILKLTPEGELQVLMTKAIMPKPQKWDGKWRIIFFDIPEDHKVERQQLRRLLLKNNFLKMQASVYISPWPLHREAIAYLKHTGFIKFIRFGKLEELDDDRDFLKRFKLM